MLYKEDIVELLNELELGYVMVIHYEGFEGRGINGVLNNTMRLKNIDTDEGNLVNKYGGDTLYKVNLNEFVLKDNYIKAKYMVYSKSKYSDTYTLDNTHCVVVPYDSITSIKLIKF